MITMQFCTPVPDRQMNDSHCALKCSCSCCCCSSQVIQSWPYSQISALVQVTGRDVLNTKLFPPHITSNSVFFSALLAHLVTVLTPWVLQPSWSTRSSTLSLFCNRQLTPVSGPRTAYFGMLHLICRASFPLLFMFLISLMHHKFRNHPALLHRHAVILDWYLLLGLISWNFDLSLAMVILVSAAD